MTRDLWLVRRIFKGMLDPRGERGVLVMSVDDLMRLTSNPFFPYLEERLRSWVTPEAR